MNAAPNTFKIMLEDLLIPIVLFISVAFVLAKYLDGRHRERMAMIEQGINPGTEAPARKSNPHAALKWGLLALFVGVGMLVGMLLDDYYGFRDRLVPAVMFMGGGLGLSLYYFIAKRGEWAAESAAQSSYPTTRL